MYSVKRLKAIDIFGILKVTNILQKCGKDMALRSNLHHWDNFYLKTLAIVFYCSLKNDIYLVFGSNTPVATFQTRKIGRSLLFQKLATSPDFSNGGIGTFCLSQIEKIAKETQSDEILCEVYDKSENAVRFYLNRGFKIYDTKETLKYKELKMKKEL